MVDILTLSVLVSDLIQTTAHGFKLSAKKIGYSPFNPNEKVINHFAGSSFLESYLIRSANAVGRTVFCKRNFSKNMTCDKTLLSMDVCFFPCSSRWRRRWWPSGRFPPASSGTNIHSARPAVAASDKEEEEASSIRWD